jgi:hypothetical protein
MNEQGAGLTEVGPAFHMKHEGRTELERHFYAAYESEETYTRFELAELQLRGAIEHYMRHEYVLAITLANAADGVLGPMARKTLGENAADRRCWHHNELMKALDFLHVQTTPKDVLTYLNWIPNDLKHNNEGLKDERLARYYGRSAQELIDAAVQNMILVLGVRPPTDSVIAQYHKEYPSWEGGLPVARKQSKAKRVLNKAGQVKGSEYGGTAEGWVNSSQSQSQVFE